MEQCIPKDVLDQNRIKMTPQRIKVLQNIIELSVPFNALSLFMRIKDSVEIDQATVYRIIKLFLKKKLIREVINSGEGQFFEISCIHNPIHPHFICSQCNKIICLKKYDYTTMKLYKKYRNNFTVESVSVIFRGICDECMKKRN